jgi:hypothetical protein
VIEEFPPHIAVPLILIAWALWLGPSAARAVSGYYARRAPNQPEQES